MTKKILLIISFAIAMIIFGTTKTQPTHCFTEELREPDKIQEIIDSTQDIKTDINIPEELIGTTDCPQINESPVVNEDKNDIKNEQIQDNTPQETQPATPEITKITISDQTLKSSFSFYKGSVKESEITEIHFQNTKPDIYDELWSANENDTEYITGYRYGSIVYIVGDKIYANKRCSYMFAGKTRYDEPLWSNLEKITGLENLDMSLVKKTNCMFYESPINEINGIKYWDMSSVENVEMMFSGCINMTKLDIELWDVSNVKDFSGMFQGHSWASDMKWQYLDVSKWNTSSATDMSHVFYGCAQLKEIPIDNWDVSKVTTFSHMFADCNAVQNLNFSNWNTASVISFDAILNDCHSLVEIDVSGLDTATCTQYSQMFETCKNLEKIIGIETWDVSNAGYYAFSETFHGCNKLKELNISNWKCRPDNIARMFKNCYELTTVDMSGFDMSNLEHITEFAMNCDKLTTIIGLENWNLENFDNVAEAFMGCPSKPAILTEKL